MTFIVKTHVINQPTNFRIGVTESGKHCRVRLNEASNLIENRGIKPVVPAVFGPRQNKQFVQAARAAMNFEKPTWFLGILNSITCIANYGDILCMGPGPRVFEESVVVSCNVTGSSRAARQ
jgi:hypothetical protein